MKGVSPSEVAVFLWCVRSPRWRPTEEDTGRGSRCFYRPGRKSPNPVSSLHMPRPQPQTHTHTRRWINMSFIILAQRCRPGIRGSFFSPYWWVIPFGVHLSDCCTVAAVSQRVVFSKRFAKWMEVKDGTNNDALCLPVMCYISVLLNTGTVCVNKAQRVLMVLCSALVPALPFIKSDGQHLFLF